MTDSPGPSLPKGGGALSGLGETFQPDLHTGTGNLSVPIPLPAGRNGLTPELTLGYSTGTGNGPFGLGWSLGLPRVARRTDKGIPRYVDALDTFVLSGFEELVAVPDAAGSGADPGTGTRTRYRPRTETTFARITHHTGAGGDFWEVRTPQGRTSRYGTPIPIGASADWTDPAVITESGGGIFAWLLSETVDPLGNRVAYGYRPDPDGGPQRYLDRVRYVDYGDPTAPQFLVGVDVVYDDPPAPGRAGRPDPFSDRRGGFELRTTLRARELQVCTYPAGVRTLATTVSLRYADDDAAAVSSGVSLLTRVQVSGHDGTQQQDLPPLELSYTDWDPWARRFRLLEGDLPTGPIGTGGTELVDLFGDGLPSVLQLNGAARYWRNRGDGRFDPARAVVNAPSGAALDQPGVTLADLDGDGRAELVVSSATRTLSWSLAAGAARAGFDPASYRSAAAPTVALTDPRVRLIDLDGDSIPDLLYAGPVPFAGYGDRRGGFGGLTPLTGDGLPLVSFTDPRVHTADMTGDGLTDLVLVHNRAVSYWPNLGYGRFGDPVAMSDAPDFGDGPGGGATGYDPRRLLLGDVVGDGTADVVYVGDGAVTVWVNRSGNGFAPPVLIPGTPRVDDSTRVRLVDLNGSGTRGILFTGVGRRGQHAFLDLTGDTKPYLLAGADNHAGATTTISYSTSSRYAAADHAGGRPWRTTLPFPVHVVASVVTDDAFAGTRHSTAYHYSDGYWDPVDREFRGFARVEETDTLTPQQPPPPAPATLTGLDSLAPSTGVPAGFDASAAGNLLTNWSFDDGAGPGPTTLTTTPAAPTGTAPSAAAAWQVVHAAAATTTTELTASTLPYGRGGSMVHVVTSGEGCGLMQRFGSGSGGPDRVLSSVWVYVVRGAVRLTTAGAPPPAGPPTADGVCAVTGAWMLLAAGNAAGPATTVTVTAGPGGAEFFVDHAWTTVPAGPAEPFATAPVRTVRWFHPGAVAQPTGGWAEPDLTGDYWLGDPPLAVPVDPGALGDPSVPRAVLREGVRAARGRLLRTELYADDGGPDADRPYEVHDFGFSLAPVLDGRAVTDPAWRSAPVVTVRPVLSRSTIWERGNDPMTRLELTGGYDEYGRAHASLDLGVARGRDPRGPGPASLALLTVTDYATRDDSTLYRIDTVSRATRYEVTDIGDGPVLDFAAAALAGTAPRALRGLTRHYYDGPAYEGLPLGQLGERGLPVRADQLVVTPELLTDAGQPGPDGAGSPLPPYLPVDGGTAPPTWPAEYPAAFQQSVTGAPDSRGPQLGYRWQPDGPDGPAGYYAQTSRVCYDVQTGTGEGRGLVVGSRDAYGGDTGTGYDGYQLLPVTVTDPAGLTTTASYDYRTCKPTLVTDANGNRSAAGYTPLGLPAWTARLGTDGADEGDTVDQPGVTYTYRLTAWDDSGGGEPMGVTTTRRTDHRWTVVAAENARRAQAGQPPLTDGEIAGLFGPDEQATHPERFVTTVEYSDGSGRLLQTRAQGDPLVVDDLGIADDPSTAATPVTTRTVDDPAAPPVVVSGWTVYDDKGHPVVTYEPFLDSGYGYRPPTDPQLAGLARTVHQYDPRGLCVRTVAADGSETLTVLGIPADLADPASVAPSAWETYHYDANDNAGRTHPTTSLGVTEHWNTPASSMVDPFGRIVTTTARTAGATLVTATSYDIDGRPLTVTDPLGRPCAETLYDMTGRPLRAWLLDAGTTHLVHDPAGGVVERRDAKGGLHLCDYDAGHRLRRGWAVDRAGGPTTLRTVTTYGDDLTEAGLTQADAAAANLLGRTLYVHDDAGQLHTGAYDLDGNPTVSTRRVLRADLLVSALPPAPGGAAWADTAYQVDWQPPDGTSLTDHAATLLDPAEYRTDSGWDALGRKVSETAPTDTTGGRSRYGYTYSRSGGISGVTLDDVPCLAQVAYDAHGRRLLAQLGNGLLVRYRYDPRTFRLVRVHAAPAQPTTGGWQQTGPVGQDHSYRYDPVGNLLLLADRTPGCGVPPGDPDALDRVFGYDALYRLVNATGREAATVADVPWGDRSYDVTAVRPYRESYDYDAADGLLSLQHRTNTAGDGAYTRTFTLAGGSNRVAALTTGSVTVGYDYDACGNVTAETSSRRLEWDYANRLATFREQAGDAEPSVYAQYRYDEQGHRVLKLVRNQNGPGLIVVYVGGFERLLTTATGSTTVTGVHDILHVADTVGRLVESHRGAPLPDDPLAAVPLRYTLSDHLGSCIATTDPTGTVLNREEYTPFGETAFGSYRRKRYRFTGKERDEESRLGYHHQRYYAPWLARWVSADPTGVQGGLNLYAYAVNAPLTHTDPTGTVPEQRQMELVESLRLPVTATDKGPGIRRGTNRAFNRAWKRWMLQGKAQAGHPPGKPFALTPPGTTTYVYPQPAEENMRHGATIDKEQVEAARQAGLPVRDPVTGAWPGAPGGTRYGQPPVPADLQGLFKMGSVQPGPSGPPPFVPTAQPGAGQVLPHPIMPPLPSGPPPSVPTTTGGGIVMTRSSAPAAAGTSAAHTSTVGAVVRLLAAVATLQLRMEVSQMEAGLRNLPAMGSGAFAGHPAPSSTATTAAVAGTGMTMGMAAALLVFAL